jgi:hypothetical protein
VASGEVVTTKQVPDRKLTSVAFSPDGLSLRLYGSDGLLLWRCYACGDTTTILKEIDHRKISRHSLSKKEMERFRITEGELNSTSAETSEHRD